LGDPPPVAAPPHATASRFPGVVVVQLKRRSGFCVAVNAGILATSGEIVELLNDDAEVTAHWADAALAWFEQPNVGAVAPLVLCSPGGERIDSAGDRYFIGGIAGKRGHGQASTLLPGVAGPVFGASGSSAFYRRGALERVGLFPASFRSYFEDVDLAFRLHRAGYEIIHEPASRLLHRVSASHGAPRRWLVEQQSCNEERVFWRNLPAGDLLRALPIHAAVLAAKAARRWHEGTLTAWLCGRLRLFGELRALARHRAEVARLGPARPLEEWNVERDYWAA
jgi:GT2 family glycosyltransferase